MIEFRFHLFSLMAVFISLGIGMLIGDSLSGGGIMAEKQTIMVSELQREYQSLKQRERTLHERVAALEARARSGDAFARGVLPLLVGDRLTGRSVLVVATRPAGYHDDLPTLLSLSGASWVRAIAPVAAPSGAETPRIAGREMAALSVTTEAGVEVDSIVLVTYPGDEAGRLAPFLGGALEVWRERSIKVVAVEGRAVEPSLVPLFQSLNLPSVDNVDQEIGKVSLVYLLAGAEGHYGIKGTARGIVPTDFMATAPDGEVVVP